MNLIKSTGTFGFYTIISRILGYLRDILIAIFLGTSFLADVFFVAFRIPNTFRRLFAEGTFNAAFVPSYTSELVKNKSKSNKFVQGISFGHIRSKLNSYLLNNKKQTNLIVEINENFWNNKKFLQINAIDAIEISNKA